MDNVIITYDNDSTSSNEELDESSSEDEHSILLSNNIGVVNNNFDTKNVKFMNMKDTRIYEDIRNKYFTPEISKIRLLIDTKNIKHDNDHNTSDYKIYFNNNDYNSNSGYHSSYNNVIGFRLVKAIIPNTLYNININNNHILFYFQNEDKNIYLDIGKYTFKEIGDMLVNKLNTETGEIFTIIKNSNTYNYTLSWNHNEIFYFKWFSSKGYSYRLFGASNIDDNENTEDYNDNTLTFKNVVQHVNHFVDLVIPQIPYIACKHNPENLHIIERIPLDENSGRMVYHSTDDFFNNYFTPIKLTTLNIQIYEDTHKNLYQCQNSDNSFEFELTILNNYNLT